MADKPAIKTTPVPLQPIEDLGRQASVAHVSRNISRNASFLMLGQVVVRLVSFGFILLAVRLLPVEEFGNLNLTLSLLMLAEAIIDCGLTRLIIRDLAREPRLIDAYLGTLIPLKVLLAVLGYILLVTVVWLADYPPALVPLSAIAGLSLLPGSLALLFDALMHARQHMVFSSLGGIVLSLTQASGGIAALLLGAGLPWIFLAMIGANLVYFVFLWRGAARRGYRFTLCFDRPLAFRLLRSALPYAGIGILGALTARSELLVLGWFEDSAAAGFYSAAAKFPEAAIFLPMMIAVATTPVMSLFHGDATGKLYALYLWASRLVAVLIVPLAVCLVVLAETIITVFFPPEYMVSVPLLQIMFAAFPFAALQLVNASVLLSSDRQAPVLLLLGSMAFVQLVFDVVLISAYGTKGAAIALFVAQALTYAVSAWYIAKQYGHPLGMLSNLCYPFSVGMLMSFIVYLLYDPFGLWALAPALLVYGAIIALGKSWRKPPA